MLLLMHWLSGELMPERAQVLLGGSLGCNLMSLIPLYYSCRSHLSWARRQYLFRGRLDLEDLVLLRKTERCLVYAACFWWREIWHGSLRFDVLTWFHWWIWIELLPLRRHPLGRQCWERLVLKRVLLLQYKRIIEAIRILLGASVKTILLSVGMSLLALYSR